MKFGVQMLSGKSYEVTAQHGDEAKQKAYALVDKEKPGLPHSDPDRRVTQVTPLGE